MTNNRLDIVSLIFGLLFLAAAGAYVTDRYLALDINTQWMWPALLVVAGVAVLAGTIRSATGGNGEE
jgi:hypothetical protein